MDQDIVPGQPGLRPVSTPDHGGVCEDPQADGLGGRRARIAQLLGGRVLDVDHRLSTSFTWAVGIDILPVAGASS